SVAGDVTVNSGGTITGVGPIAGNLTSNTFGTVVPGLGSGQFTLSVGGGATTAPSSTASFALNGAIAGATYAQLAVTGTVTINNTILNATSNSGGLANQTLQIVTLGTLTGGSQFSGWPDG